MLWRVAGEGNANIVLSPPPDADDSLVKHPHINGMHIVIIPQSSLNQAGTVLRVSKRQTHGPLVDELEDYLWSSTLGPLPHDELSALKRQVAYVERVLGPLLGPSLTLPSAGVLCSLPQEAAEALSATHPWLVEGTPAILMQNASTMPRNFSRGDVPLASPSSCLCVEIKPKWGTMPGPNFFLPPGPGSDLKRKVPRFKLHQMLKRGERGARRGGDLTQTEIEIDEMTSSYDPIDLFSEDKPRMERALQSLIDCPSNNFRVFVDGTLRFGGRPDADSSSRKLQVYQTSLISESFDDLNEAMSECLFGSFGSMLAFSAELQLKKLLVAALIKSKVLATLKAVQELDRIGIEGIFIIYEKLKEDLKVSGQPSGLDSNSNSSHSEREQMAADVRDYLISATAKDCSIMVAIQLISSDFPSLLINELESHQSMASLHIDQIDLKAQEEMQDGHSSHGHSSHGDRLEGSGQALDTPSLTDAAVHLVRPIVYNARAVIYRGDGGDRLGELMYTIQFTLVDLDCKSHHKIVKHLELDRRIVACGLRHWPSGATE